MQLILGLDLGKKTGIAKAYDSIGVAVPYKVVFSFKDLVAEVLLLQPAFLVVGWPLLLNGMEGLQCSRVKSSIANLIHSTYSLPVYFEDERFSSDVFKGLVNEDAMSAAWVLQKFLDSKKNKYI